MTIGIAQAIKKSTDNATVSWRAQKLAEAGQELIDTCNITVDVSQIKRSRRKVNAYFETEYLDILDSICFLLCCYDDLAEYSNNKHLYNRVFKSLSWVQAYFDSKLDKPEVYEKAEERYIKWVS